jgi:nucleotide-binding universal stress UspA family protein
MKKIIVPTDFSEQAKFALDLASEIAEQAGAEIVLMNVLEYSSNKPVFLGSSSITSMGSVSTGVARDDVYFIELYKRRKEQMAELLSDPKYGKVDITDKLMMGNPYHAIVEEITEFEADLIVMGTTGVNDWQESLIGSTAERVVRNASCPVITLRNGIRMQDIRRIALASDFEDQNPAFISFVKSIHELFEAVLHLVYINTPGRFKNQREIYEELQAYAEAHELENHELHIYSHQLEEDGIVWFTEDYDMDMIMMATSGRSALSRLFDSSIAEDVVNFSRKPVVTFNLKQSGSKRN